MSLILILYPGLGNETKQTRTALEQAYYENIPLMLLVGCNYDQKFVDVSPRMNEYS